MDEDSHVLIKDKIRCIQKKIMDQLAADLNSALNDANILKSPLPNILLTSSSSATTLKTKRRRKRPINNDLPQSKTEASDSTTSENARNANNDKQSIVSDDDDMPMPSKTQSLSLAAASESDSISPTDEIRRRRRPFKKPMIPSVTLSISKTASQTKLTRCPSIKISNYATNTTTTATLNTHLSHRRHSCRNELRSRMIDSRDDPSTLSSSFSLTTNNNNNNNYCNGKRKRSRAIIHDDFSLRNSSLHEYDMTCLDEPNLTNVSSNSSSSLNLSDSDKDPCLTSNEADDEQSDWPKEESSAPHKKSWRKDHEDEASENNDDDNDNEMLTSSNRTLQKFVNSAFNMMLTNSKYTIQNRIKTFANRQFLTGDRKHAGSKNIYTHPYPKRHIRLLKETRRSHHHSYNHKRVKSEHHPHKHHDLVESIDTTNIAHPLMDKIDWIPTTELNLNHTNRTAAPLHVNYRHYRQKLGHESTPMDTSERIDNEL